jgi:uncharacterized protein YjbI with pentapeptide repeats
MKLHYLLFLLSLTTLCLNAITTFDRFSLEDVENMDEAQRVQCVLANMRALIATKSGSGCYLARAQLANHDLTDADLEGANLAHAHLEGSNLTGADLARANLTGAHIKGTNFSNAVIIKTIFYNTVDFESAIFNGALRYKYPFKQAQFKKDFTK